MIVVQMSVHAHVESQTDFHFTPNAQIWPRELNEYIGGDPNAIYLVIQDLGAFFMLCIQ